MGKQASLVAHAFRDRSSHRKKAAQSLIEIGQSLRRVPFARMNASESADAADAAANERDSLQCMKTRVLQVIFYAQAWMIEAIVRRLQGLQADFRLKVFSR
jgi:hypothetical protein